MAVEDGVDGDPAADELEGGEAGEERLARSSVWTASKLVKKAAGSGALSQASQ